jgi:hypothetical protein
MDWKLKGISWTLLFLIASLECFVGKAQGNQKPYQYLSISSDNDFYYLFGYSNDRYYTAGNSISYGLVATPKAKWINRIFPSLEDSTSSVFSFRVFQQLNTPTYLQALQIDQFDYPFAAALYATIARNTLSTSGKVRWKTELSIGIMGAPALGKESQEFFHQLTNSMYVTGWKDQLPNSLILNYNIEYERKLFSQTDKRHVVGTIQSGLGTFSSYVQPGFSLNVVNKPNLMTSDFNLWPSANNWTIMFSAAPSLRFVFWNSMLQGSPFDQGNYYSVSYAAITKMLPAFALKLTLAKGRHTLHGQQTFLGKEFQSVDPQVYGTIAYTVRLGKSE